VNALRGGDHTAELQVAEVRVDGLIQFAKVYGLLGDVVPCRVLEEHVVPLHVGITIFCDVVGAVSLDQFLLVSSQVIRASLNAVRLQVGADIFYNYIFVSSFFRWFIDADFEIVRDLANCLEEETCCSLNPVPSCVTGALNVLIL